MQLIDLSLNEVPYRETLYTEFLSSLGGLTSYERGQGQGLIELIREQNGLVAEGVFLSSGADGAIDTLFCFLRAQGLRLLIPEPSYSGFSYFARKHGLQTQAYSDLNEAIEVLGWGEGDALLICRPSNPLGHCQTLDSTLLSGEKVLIVDEAYIECCPDKSLVSLLRTRKNTYIIRSFSKAYGLSGMRVGYLLTHEHNLKTIKPYFRPFPVSTPALESARILINNRSRVMKLLDELLVEKIRLQSQLSELGFEVCDSATYFFCLKFQSPTEARSFLGFCASQGVTLGDFSYFNLVRIGTGGPSENEALLKLARLFNEEKAKNRGWENSP